MTDLSGQCGRPGRVGIVRPGVTTSAKTVQLAGQWPGRHGGASVKLYRWDAGRGFVTAGVETGDRLGRT